MIPDKISTWCVPSSIWCAWIYAVKTGRPVRIAHFHISEGVDHVQAQAQQEDGSWTYLTEVWDGTSVAAITYGKNIPEAPEPYCYVGLMDFIQEQKQVLNLNI